jgi:glyoxylase-like metal-dependent hydrolase (beta-lactamase superfamily II)
VNRVVEDPVMKVVRTSIVKTLAVKTLAVACVAMLLTANVRAQGSYAPLDRPLTIEQVPGTRIFYSIGNPGIPGKANEGNTSNAGYVITDDGVVVFDALGTPSLGWALLQDIQQRTDKKVRFVIASHYHADHIYGLQAFKDHTGAEIVAQERAAEYKENEETADERADQRLDQRRSALSPWVNKDTRVVPPDITFKEKMTISLGGKQMSLIYAGPAHSASDIMMMVQPDGVLFAGDIVQNSRIPFMNSDDVNTVQWLKALDEVLQLDPKFIIPGHGKPSAAAKQAIAFTHDYISYVRGAMSKAVENWTDFDTAYEQTDWSTYKSLPAFSNNNRGNAYRIYLELEASQFKK